MATVLKAILPSAADADALRDAYLAQRGTPIAPTAVADVSPPNKVAKLSPPRQSPRATQDQLPFPAWPEEKRALANDLARTSLFTITRTGPRREFRDTVLASQSNLQVRYTGQELRVWDEDVFLQLLHYHRGGKPDMPVVFTRHQLLSDIGWAPTAQCYQRLEETLTRLKATEVKVIATDGTITRTYADSLIGPRLKTETPNGVEYALYFPPGIANLFSPISYSTIAWEIRMKLSPLGKRLHAFYATHRQPFALSPSYLHKLSGSTVESPGKWKQILTRALAELQEVGFLSHYAIEKDLVRVTRT